MYAADVQARINLGIRRRLRRYGKRPGAHQADEGLLDAGLAILYYGDEIGMGTTSISATATA
jgi:hypothetical protein